MLEKLKLTKIKLEPSTSLIDLDRLKAEVVVALEVTATGSNDAVLNEIG
jgi:hypothetical protein